MSKFSKYILACGCSYTDPNFRSTLYPEYDTSYPKWPELVGDYLELMVKNLGESGIGNDLIFTKAIEDIIHNHDKIEMVVIGWSEWHRFAVVDTHLHNPESTLKPRDPKNVTHYNKASIEYYEYLWTSFFDLTRERNFLKKGYDTWFKRIVMLQKLCDQFGIKHLQATLCGSVNRSNYKPLEEKIGKDIPFSPQDSFKMMLKSPYFYDVKAENVIGWPFLESLGGFEFNRSNMLPLDYRVGGNDMHPNREGHEFIAQYFIEKYKEVYV